MPPRLPSVATTLLVVALATLAIAPAAAEVCSVEQVTDGADGFSQHTSSDAAGRYVAFESTLDLAGDNAARNLEPFLWDSQTGSFRQLIAGSTAANRDPKVSGDGGWVVFTSDADPTGENSAHRQEVFLYDVAAARLSQMTRSASGENDQPQLSDDGMRVVFLSTANPLGGDADGQGEVYLADRNELRLRQLTSSGSRVFSAGIAHDGARVAYTSPANPLGLNGDGGEELFFWEDGAALRQLTQSTSTTCINELPANYGPMFTADDGTLLFSSSCNLTGTNADGSFEVFTVDLATGAAHQWTSSTTDSFAASISGDGGLISFASRGNPTGQNADGGWEGFLVRTATGAIEQLTQTVAPGDGGEGSFDRAGRRLVFTAKGDLTGGNPEHNRELFRRVCSPDPPSATWLTTPQLPGFRFQVRITAASGPVEVREETDCVGETLCISGALPGRSELFLRIIGPRPNGYKWPNIVKFTTSRVEVWIEQTATGALQYYDLPAVPADSSELPGLVDRHGFLP